MEYKVFAKACVVAAAICLMATPIAAMAYDVGTADALNSLNDGYNYRPPSTWKGTGGHNESGGPMMMDEYLAPPKKKQAPQTDRQNQGDQSPDDNVREGDTR